jgi:HAE1 family hydrophobic/amphiphilic exporter-1
MKSLPRFSVKNPVIVGLLMATIIGGGLYASLTLVREMFPESRPKQVLITTPYPGASPEEVEKGIALRHEEALEDIDDIEKVTTTINEGLCSIVVELESDVDDVDQSVDDIKTNIDAIPRDELPDEAEETIVRRFEPTLPVISVTLYGETDDRTLKNFALKLEDELLQLPGVTRVSVGGVRQAELSVEVLPEKMLEYGLSLAQVADAIRRSNLDLPGGQVKTDAQNISVRTLGESDEAEVIAETILKTGNNGQLVRVRDIGRVVDGFEDSDIKGRFAGLPAVDLTISKTTEQDAIRIAENVKAFVAGKMGQADYEWDSLTKARNALGITTEAQRIHEQALATPFPAYLKLGTHTNLARFIEGRLELLTRNGFYGLILVFLSLLVFLNLRVAFWVMAGLCVSIAGALMLMAALGATLNLISMFGLIVVLGIIVDDAIVVGENIFARFERGDGPEQAAVRGAEEVAWPVTVAVLTTVAAFAPLVFIEGRMGDFMGVLPVVVVCALTVSLFESLMILPSHLAESLHKIRRPTIGAAPPTGGNPWARFVAWQSTLISQTVPDQFARLLRVATRYRYVTLSFAFAALIISITMVVSDRVPLVFLQKMDSETLTANLEMPIGTPARQTEAMIKQVEAAIDDLDESGDLATMYTLVGASLTFGSGGGTVSSNSHLAQVIAELHPLDERGSGRSSEEILGELREKTANLPGIRTLTFRGMQGGPSGAEIEIEISGGQLDTLTVIADRFKAALANYEGVFDIADNNEGGRREIRLELLDSARPLRITTRDLATEVRGAFYGIEARTIQRPREEVDIRVIFPRERREHLYELESMRIHSGLGTMVPIVEVARMFETDGYSTIRRVDGRRAVTVTADVDQDTTTGEKVIASLAPLVREMQRTYPETRIDFTGNKRESAKSMGSLQRDFLIALVLIYAMLAALFRSYFQPMVVMAAVPFGMTGAIVGHYIHGSPMTILSMIGIVALTGIVVNDSLIMVNFINSEVEHGRSHFDAVIAGGRRRLRPILLTSLTTILGLAPLMSETSLQARFLIPMAISITWGLAFATLLTLVVVPSIYLIFEDLKIIFRKLKQLLFFEQPTEATAKAH